MHTFGKTCRWRQNAASSRQNKKYKAGTEFTAPGHWQNIAEARVTL